MKKIEQKNILKRTVTCLTAFTCVFSIFCTGKTDVNDSIIDSEISLTVEAATTYDVIFPVNNGCKIAYYQEYDPNYEGHEGIDIHSNGDDTIYASKSGTVDGLCNTCPHTNMGFSHKGKFEEEGNYIKIKGDDGIYYWYYHLKQNTLLVSKGDRVTAGQPIATMGSSGISTGKHLHFQMTTGSNIYSTAIIANPVGKYNGQVNYSNGPYGKQPTYTYDLITAGNYYIKNNSTGTYLSVDSAKAADKQNVSVAAKSNSKAFQFKTTGGTEHYLYSMLDNNYVLNPYSDTPTAGTNVTLFKKVTDGTQIWGFESVNGGYIIRLKYNPNCVLAVSGSNVQLATYTGAANQIWTLEKADVVLSSIKINEDSFCSIYENGSTFKPDGLTLTATYSDGSTKNITEGYTLSEVNLDTIGDAAITATYGGKTATAAITVQDLFEGDGTDASPYLVNTATDLENVAKMVNNPLANGCYGHASYKQTADIDLSEYSNWTPIGVYINSNSVFNGNYNGDYNKISNLNVNYDKLYTGLFGRINSASQNAVVKNLSVSGNVSGAKGCVGGIVGETGYGAAIENCDFTGTVNGLTLVGGITGKIQCGATITNCYANCEVTASEGNAGGIVGGILVGANNYSTDATIGNSYFVGKISGTGIGGICGLQTIQTTKDCKITYTNNYYLNSAAAGGVAGTAQAGCTGLISSQLKTIATDLGSPFVDNADDTLNNGYPVFEWQIETPDERIPGDANNDGTIDLKDVVMIRRYVAGGWDVELDASNADVNADNVVDLKDVVMLRRYIAGGWDVELK